MGPSNQAILAAVISFFIVTLLFAAIVFVCRGASKRQRSSQPRPRNRKRQVPEARAAPKSSSDLSSIAISESTAFDPTLNRVSMAELVKATGDFSPDLIVGDGSFGLVYKAKLSSGVVVAVKKLDADAFQGFREFRAEMETLGKIGHPNIVKILGYCKTGTDRILIYEFIEKGSLDQWLYDTSASSYSGDGSVIWLPLPWATRIKIIKGVARGLAFMHNLENPIIHRDIKASNILLDANFEAHIADFGLARRIDGSHSHVSTQVAGTMGYMPPEYLGGSVATTMGDVYSFGILMLEIVTGRRPHFPFMGEDGKELRLMEWVNMMMEQNRCIEMVDSSISRDGLKENGVNEVFRIGQMCSNEIGKARPAMKQVVELLDGICP